MKNEDFYYDFAKKKKDWQSGDLKIALDFIKEKSHGGNKKLLDIGCGTADIANFLPANLHYIGLDPSEFALEKARLKYPKASFVLGFGEALPLEDNSVDMIFSYQTVQSFTDPRKSFQEMMRVIKPGGYVMMVAPNHECPWANISAIRHYGLLQRLAFIIRGFIDFGLRSLGILSFRTLPQNYTEATGRYEYAEDDLHYVISAYEVATLFKRHGFKKIFSKDSNPKGKRIANRIKLWLKKVPVFRYYGGGMLFIFQKTN